MKVCIYIGDYNKMEVEFEGEDFGEIVDIIMERRLFSMIDKSCGHVCIDTSKILFIQEIKPEPEAPSDSSI